MGSAMMWKAASPEVILNAAIDHALADGMCVVPGASGVVVVDGVWVEAGEEVCPIGALLRGTATKTGGGLQAEWDDAARILGVSPAWVDEFVCGFDDTDDPTGLHDDAWDLGAELRAAIIPMGINDD